MYSLLFRGATVVDGSGSPAYTADVAVVGDRIAAIGAAVSGPAATIVDAGGLVLAPGFIDIHSHTDSTVFRYPGVESKAFQGVTTEVVGNCGLGLSPVNQRHLEEFSSFLAMHAFHVPEQGITWNDFATCADAMDQFRPGINLAPLVGHAPLRIAALGMDNREPSAPELAEMRRLLDEALRQGAWGMSTGLIYPPGSFAATAELVELAKVLARHEALYASHIRNEGAGLFEALDEAIAIGHESGARVQVSHLKALGKGNWGRSAETLARISAAREGGVDVAADQYPYAASATTLAAVVPQWAQEGGVAAMLQRLRDPLLADRLAAEIGKEMTAREGADGIMVTDCHTPANRELSGRTVAEIARSWGCAPEAAVIRLIAEEEASVGAIFFSMIEDDVTRILADPEVAVGSDGHGLNAEAAAGEPTHPRSYGTFTRVLGRYVREKKVLTLEAAVRKMTSLPAGRVGFTERGLVGTGFAADLVLFDPETVADLADYAEPHRYATGVVHLLVGGRFVIRDGRLTGERPGRVLRRKGRGE